VEDPKVVERGQLVTVTFERPGMMLTTQGRALEAAAAGGAVPVRNLSSNRVIHAVATGPGRVSVGIIGPTHFAMN
jgi:flagella basal body P-ring formation protein FlgA